MGPKKLYETLLEILDTQEAVAGRVAAGDMPQFGDRDVIKLNHMVSYVSPFIPDMDNIMTAFEHYIRVKRRGMKQESDEGLVRGYIKQLLAEVEQELPTNVYRELIEITEETIDTWIATRLDGD